MAKRKSWPGAELDYDFSIPSKYQVGDVATWRVGNEDVRAACIRRDDNGQTYWRIIR